jgi:hypothetical protein
MQLTKDMLERNLAQMKAQQPALVANTLLEAGKAIGKGEGAINVLQQLVAIMSQPEPAARPARASSGTSRRAGRVCPSFCSPAPPGLVRQGDQNDAVVGQGHETQGCQADVPEGGGDGQRDPPQVRRRGHGHCHGAQARQPSRREEASAEVSIMIDLPQAAITTTDSDWLAAVALPAGQRKTDFRLDYDSYVVFDKSEDDPGEDGDQFTAGVNHIKDTHGAKFVHLKRGGDSNATMEYTCAAGPR